MNGVKGPSAIYAETGGGDAFRVAMLEAGYVVPNSPKFMALAEKKTGKRIKTCGLTHLTDWSEWRDYNDSTGPYQGRWCKVCAAVESRETPTSTTERVSATPSSDSSQGEAGGRTASSSGGDAE